jgi:hypothetical protein
MKAEPKNTDMILTKTQSEIMYKTPLVKDHRGETLKTVSIYGSGQHRSMKSLEDRGLVKLSPIQPFPGTYIFATRKGQSAGIGQELSLNFEERTEKEITLNKNDRFTLVEALKGYKPGFDPNNRVAKLIERLSA